MREEDFRFVKLLLERRRRRLDANEEHFEEKLPESTAGGMDFNHLLKSCGSRYARRLEIDTDNNY